MGVCNQPRRFGRLATGKGYVCHGQIPVFFTFGKQDRDYQFSYELNDDSLSLYFSSFEILVSTAGAVAI